MKKKRMSPCIVTALVLVIFTCVNVLIHIGYSEKITSDRKDTEATAPVETVKTGEGIKVSSERKEEPETERKENQPVVSFEEYQRFYEYFSKEFGLKDYDIKYNSAHSYLLFVEPEWSFGKREKLILPGKENTSPTMEYMLLQNKNETVLITLGVSYNPNYIGNDLQSCFFQNIDLRGINKKLDRSAVGAVMSYRNLLFHIQIGKTEKKDDILEEVLSKVSRKVTEYFER